jgi:hypothetical protein
MSGSVGPLDFVLIALAGWMNEHQQQVVPYLLAENRILKQQLGKKRLRLTDEQRRLLAVKGRALGRRVLSEVASIVTPDTILRGYRQLVARKWDHSSKRRPGRPPVIHMLRTLVVRMAMEYPGWGYDRIEGEVRKLGHRLAPTTVRNILKANGIEPAPERRKHTMWRQFLSAPLGLPCGIGLLHGRGMHMAGPRHVLCSLRHGPVDAARARRRDHAEPRYSLDDADGEESDRPDRRRSR